MTHAHIVLHSKGFGIERQPYMKLPIYECKTGLASRDELIAEEHTAARLQ